MPLRRAMPPWLRAGVAMFAVGWGANQFASLLLAYRRVDGLSVAVTDALFGTYALGLIPVLLFVGPVSDRLGRRPMARAAVVVSAVATVVLMAGDASSALLYPGRLLAGIASGLIFAPGTAWVKELSGPPFAAAGDRGAGARRAAVALTGGFGSGPLVAGLIAQYAPAPLVTPYLAHLLVVALAAATVWTAPETVRPDAGAARGGEVGASVRSRAFLTGVAPVAPWVFVAASVSITVAPALVVRHTSSFEYAFAGVIAGLTLGTGVLVQPLARKLSARTGQERPVPLVGLGLVVLGLVIETATARTAQPVLAAVAAVALGGGYGFCLVGGLLQTQRIAAPDELAALTAVFYALTYIGFASPIVLAELNHLAGYPVLLAGAAAAAAVTAVAVARAGGGLARRTR